MEAASVSGEVAGNVGVELETELHETDRCPSPTGVSSSQKACTHWFFLVEEIPLKKKN